MEFGKRFLEARLAAGLTQAELAEGLVTPGYISHIEVGKRVPGKKIISVLSSRLGVNLEEYIEQPNSDQNDFELAQIQFLVTDGDFEKALKLIEQIEKSSNKSIYVVQRSKFLKSVIHTNLGNLDSAIGVLSHLFDETRKITLRSEIAIELLRAYRNNDEIQYGVTKGEEFLRLAKSEIWPKTDHITLICQIANLLLISGNQKRALDLANQAKILTEEFKDPRSISQVHWVASSIFNKQGDFAKSAEQMEIAVKFAEIAELNSRMPIMKNDLAMQLLHGTREEVTEGIRLAEYAFLEASIRGLVIIQISSAETLFRCYLNLGDIEKAKSYLETAEKISLENQGIDAQVISYSKAKLQFHYDNNLETLFKEFATAATMQQMFKHDVMLEWRFLANEAKKQGNFEIATHALEQALNIQVQLGV